MYLGKAFKLYEIEKQHIPPFTELRVKKLWNHFKRNKTVCNYMPKYPENRFQNESSSLECVVLSIQKRLEEWLKLPIKQGIKNMIKAKMIWLKWQSLKKKPSTLCSHTKVRHIFHINNSMQWKKTVSSQSKSTCEKKFEGEVYLSNRFS